MRSRNLAQDYIKRCKARIGAVEYLFKAKSWPDVVREAQEVVELALKALLRNHDVEVPRIHDVSELLESEKAKFSKEVQSALPKLVKISRTLRRDRELAFYGSEDLTPSDFYKKDDAEQALESAQFVVKTVTAAMKV